MAEFKAGDRVRVVGQNPAENSRWHPAYGEYLGKEADVLRAADGFVTVSAEGLPHITLLAEWVAPAGPPPGAVRVRIAVAVTAEGVWLAHGTSCSRGDASTRDFAAYELREDGPVSVVWVEADVPLPQSVTVEGRVTGAD